MKLRGALVAALIMIGSLVLAFPPAFATNPATMNHECFGAMQNTNAGTATCTIDTKYDLIAVAIQVGDGTSNAHNEIKVSTVVDNHGNLFGLRAQTQHSIGANCLAGNCFDTEIWSATALGTFPYSDTVTVTLDHALSGGSEGFIETFDVTGVDNTTVATGGEFCESSCGGSPIANVPNMSFNPNAAFFALAGVFDDCSHGGSPGTSCSAGTGYTLAFYPTNPEGDAMWSVSGITSPTTAPMGVFSAWYETAAVFGPLAFATQTVITKCLFTQIQCWWYPLLFYGVFGGAFMVVGRAGSVDPRGLTYLLLAALTFCSLIQVQMNMTNIMLPVILSITGIAYAVRGR